MNRASSSAASSIRANEMPNAEPFNRIDASRKEAISILQNTEWPRDSAILARDLLQIISKSPKLQALPKDVNNTPKELRDVMEHFIPIIGSVSAKLKKASKKFGGKREFSDIIKHPFASLNKEGCTRTLQECRNAVESALVSFPDGLSNEARIEPLGETSAGAQKTDSHSATPAIKPTNSHASPNEHLGVPTNAPQQTVSQRQPTAAPPPAGDHSLSAANQPEKSTSFRREGLTIARKTFNTVNAISGMIPVVGSYVGGAATVGLAVVELIQNMDSNEEAAEDLASHTSKLSGLLDHFKKRSFETQTEETSACISGELESVRAKVEALQSQSSFKKAFSATDRAESLAGLQDTIKAALEEMQLLVGLNTVDLLTELYNSDARKETRRLLDRLGDANYGARGDAVEDVVCLPGTRVQILKRIDDWIRNSSDSERVLWIRGMAGRGKSAIASTVAHEWRYRAVCAIFHFRRGQNQSERRLVCALGRQLGSSVVPQVKEAVLQSIRENEDIAQERLQDQFDALLVASLERLQNTTLPILFTVDALDECDDVDYAVNFVKLIDRHSSSLPPNVKFLLTSRPEAPLLRALEPKKWQMENLDVQDDVEKDLTRFVQHTLSQIREDHGLAEDWPSEKDISKLVKMSQGLFQWARTALKYIGDRSPADTLAELFESPAISDGLDELYLQILSKAFEKVKSNSRTRELFIQVLATLLAAPYPVSLEIVGFLHLDQDILKNKTPDQAATFIRQNILSDLNSLLLIPSSTADPIHLMHTSIRDLLVDQERCGERPYFVNLAVSHSRLTRVCFRLLGRDLKENICRITNLSKASTDIQDIVERLVPKGLQYCCRSWSTHFGGSAPNLESGTDHDQAVFLDLKRFSEERVLHWLEVMSLIGAVRDAIAMAKQTHRKLQQSPSEIFDPSLTGLWNDIHRFVTAFHEPISFGPLHIYASALPFCPTKTKLWDLYGSRATNRMLHGPQTLTWPLDVWSRSVGTDVHAVAFVPSGKVLASGSKENTIQLWNPETGAPLGGPMRGHSAFIESIAISPNGKILASGSSDKTIRLWDMESGQQIGRPLTGHGGAIHSVAFSTNGRVLASGSHDSTIRLWDVDTGSLLGEPLRGHGGFVRSVAVSPNGTILASGSSDKTIRLWDIETGRQTGEPLAGHSDGVRCVIFSPDGQVLASGSDDNTIRFWNATTGLPVGMPSAGHADAVICLAYSPDGKTLASGSYDDTIRLWDSKTGSPIGEPLKGHTMFVLSVAFSPDGNLLASGGGEGTIRSWNMDADLAQESSELPSWQSTSTLAIAFSPDHQTLAYGYDQGTIQLWDVETGRPRGAPLTGHTNTVHALTFSPDGKILASGSHDSTIGLWDAKTGDPIGAPLTGHSNSVLSVAFSPDGNILASGSHDATVRLWDVKTGKAIAEPLGGNQKRSVSSIGFLSDAKTLASGSGSSGVALWSTESWALIRELPENHSDWTHYVATSLDGKLSIKYFRPAIPSWDARTCLQCDPSPSLGANAPKDTVEHFKTVPLTAEGQWINFISDRLFWLPSNYWDDKNPKIVLSQGKLIFIHQGVLSIFDVSRALKL